jgi:DNA-binding MarR family transcriptional regulator
VPTATQALCLDANSCVLLLNELEAAGYAERHRDASDRRRHLAALGPKDRALLRDLLRRALEAPSAHDEHVAVRVGHDAG